MRTNIELIERLAELLIWIAPVGVQHIDYQWPRNCGANLRGFMVCRRSRNNVDNGSTRVDYLTTEDGQWKKPFAEDRNLFPTMGAALRAAALATKLESS